MSYGKVARIESTVARNATAPLLAGGLGNGLKFDGINDKGQTTGSNGIPYDPGKSYFLDVVYRPGLVSLPALFSTSSGFLPNYGISFYGRWVSNGMLFAVNDQYATLGESGYATDPNRIYRGTVVLDGTGVSAIVKLWQDGKLVANNTFAKVGASPLSELVIGYGFGSDRTDPTIISILLKELTVIPTDNQVLQFITDGVDIAGTTLVHYDFNQVEGNTVWDKSGNGRHATLTNFASTTNYQGGAWVDAYTNLPAK